MKPLFESLIGKHNIDNASIRTDGKSFFVWPVSRDFVFVNDHPHWIEMTMFDTKKYQVGKVYIFDEDKLVQDAKNFVEAKTMVFVTNISQDELIQRLEKYRITYGADGSVQLSNEKWIDAYSAYQFKHEYIFGNK